MLASPVSCNGCISFFSFWKIFHCKNVMMLSFTFNGQREKGYLWKFWNHELSKNKSLCFGYSILKTQFKPSSILHIVHI